MTTNNEAFEKWFDKEFGDAHYPTEGMKLSWQAATAEANKRIAELESEVANLHLNIKAQEQLGYELQASNNYLREALEENHYSNSSDKAIKLYNDAMYSIPAESLALHDDEVAKCKVDAERYQFVRQLTPREFAEIYDINLKTGVHFDHLISQALKEVK